MSRTRDSITFGKTVIRYRIVRTAEAKSITITVRPDRSIIVSAPKGTRARRIAMVVSNRGKWIIEQMERLSRFAQPSPREFVSGETFFYLGRQYRLKVIAVRSNLRRPILRFDQGRFFVQVPRRWGRVKRPREIRELLVQWYREHAAQKISQVANRYAKKLGVSCPDICIHELKKRWASCGKNGTLRFNWRIVMASMTIVEYIVAHEFCHLRYKDHSPAFWRTLSLILPDYLTRREMLDNTGPRFDF